MHKSAVFAVMFVACLVTGSAIGLMVRSGDEVFGTPVSTTLWYTDEPAGHTQWEYRQVVAGDFNGDGFQDAAMFAGTGTPMAFDLSIRVAWGDGTGAFTGYSVQTMEFLHEDLAMNKSWGVPVQAADMNNDGRDDLLLKSRAIDKEYGAILLSLLSNGDGSFTCAGDINDDGQTSVPDLLTLLEDWNCQESQGMPD